MNPGIDGDWERDRGDTGQTCLGKVHLPFGGLLASSRQVQTSYSPEELAEGLSQLAQVWRESCAYQLSFLSWA